jgi:hypothetical protein
VRGPIALAPASPDLNPLGCILWLYKFDWFECQNYHLLAHQQTIAACHYISLASDGEIIGRGELEMMWVG